MIKNLQSLRKNDLLKYKDYGLGKENLWSLKPHPIIKELGYSPPRAEIHTFKYEHEKACADVFVSLALTGKLLDWQAHKKISKSVIPDRIAHLDTLTYIEVEMGSQDKILQKATAYRKHYFETPEDFQVWFLVKEQKQYDDALYKLEDFTDHYQVELLSNFVSDTSSDTYSDWLAA